MQRPAPQSEEAHSRLKTFASNAPMNHLTDFSNEPLVLNMSTGAANSMYPGVNSSLAEFGNVNLNPHLNHGALANKSSLKRSREELNLKEKKRMSKLNNRIQQFKDMLDEAGIASKKNKQSILDNTAYYIKMLQSDLSSAKQRAERAEQMVERPSKARKLVESCAVAMVTGKLSGEIASFSREFAQLIGRDMSDMQSSASLFLSRMGEKFGQQLSQLDQATERVVFWDTLRTSTEAKMCRFALTLIKGEDGTTHEFQCIVIPKSELEF